MQFLRSSVFLIFICFCFTTCILQSCNVDSSDGNSSTVLKGPQVPSDWFFNQRFGMDDEAAYYYSEEAQAQAVITMLEIAKKVNTDASLFRAADATWEQVGPYNVGGRITDIEFHPLDGNIVFIGSASGGIFKSTNGTLTFDPILDEFGALPIGDIAIAQSDPDIIYVGTGEPNAGGGSLAYDGIGILRSEDGGDNWAEAGLKNMGSTGRLHIDPTNSDRVFAAMMGPLFKDDSNRGVYRTEDGGSSWDQVLFLNDSTGSVDLILDPFDTDILYAAMWERVRRPNRRNYGGPACGIWKSIDGGDNWTKLSGGLPLGSGNGRIAITASLQQQDLLFAIYMKSNGNFKGFYRSDDGGDNWATISSGVLSSNYSAYGWWFTGLHAHPTDVDRIMTAGLSYAQSINGGAGWSFFAPSFSHVDQHALAFNPDDPTNILLGTDGGLYNTTDDGINWTHLENIPNIQFYTCKTEQSSSGDYFGGTQDNGTLKSAGPLNWSAVNGGDGFVVEIDPVDPNYVYAESQYGVISRSTNGGISFFSAISGIDFTDRSNWNTPFVIDPNEHQRLYLGTQRLYRSDNQAGLWTPITGDLTNGGTFGNLTYGSITSIAVAENNANIIMVGADDGSVQVSTDMAGSFSRIDSELPDRWVTSVKADPDLDSTFYVTISGFRYGDDPLAHIWRTDNLGQDWFSVSGDLPDMPVNDILIDPEQSGRLFAATDCGVYFTEDTGKVWLRLGDLPVVVVTALDLHDTDRELVAATFGRSMYTFDLANLPDVVEPPSGINEPEVKIKVYPNPVSDFIYVEGPQPIAYKIYDHMGRLISQDQFPMTNRIELSALNAGSYTIQFAFLNNVFKSTSIIKN